jgi:hypothetical protein
MFVLLKVHDPLSSKHGPDTALKQGEPKKITVAQAFSQNMS